MTKKKKNIFFEERWTKKISDIEEMCLSVDQAKIIFESFKSEYLATYLFYPAEPQDFIRLTVDLKIALIQANNNYKEKFPNFWNQFSKLKLPDMDINQVKMGK